MAVNHTEGVLTGVLSITGALKPVQPVVQLVQLRLLSLHLAGKLALPGLSLPVQYRSLLHSRLAFLDFILNIVPHSPALLLNSEPRFVCSDSSD